MIQISCKRPTGSIKIKIHICSNYSDLTRPHPKWWFSTGNPLISEKIRLVKYYSIWPESLPSKCCCRVSLQNVVAESPFKIVVVFFAYIDRWFPLVRPNMKPLFLGGYVARGGLVDQPWYIFPYQRTGSLPIRTNPLSGAGDLYLEQKNHPCLFIDWRESGPFGGLKHKK